MVDTVDADATLGTIGDAVVSSDDDDPDAVPARVGRYVILEQIGRGGMGIVFAAYDPELDRKVAIKLLDPRREDIAGRVRLLREAQAMAKLQHPNVIAIHDVGTIGDRVFIAMEFVRGRTLGRHLADVQPSWREALALLIAAGRGLAAAHEVGLVHRDFKPDNVLVSASGRVQVGDFGLARATEGAPAEDEADEPSGARSAASALATAASLRVTHTGALLGTPAYMAPEQHARRPTDARTDQFAFCVAAYEVLYGARPFAGDTAQSLATSVLAGDIRPPPRATRIPLAIARAILRGLSAAPEDRWPDMAALLVRLERAPRRARMRWAVAGGSAILLTALVVDRSLSRPTSSCVEADALLAGIWDGPKRREIERALLGTSVSYARDTWVRVDALIDARADEWAARRVGLCESHVRREVSDERFDREMTCLGRRQREITTLVDALALADSTTIQNAVTAASQLTAAGECDDAERLWAELEPPAADAIAQVAELRARLDAARVGADPGRLTEARTATEAAAAAADEIAYRPLTAEAQLRLGWVYDRVGEYSSAETALRRAWFDALASGHDRIAAGAAADLLLVLGVRQTRFDEGLVWAKNAEALMERRKDDRALAARYHANLGNMLGKRGDLAGAIAQLRLAVSIEEARLGPESPAVARQVASLGLALHRAGEYTAAQAELERARDIQIRVLGPEHPEVATTLNNLGSVYARQGRYDDARLEHERALQIRSAALGPHHPDTASSHTNLGVALRHLGKWDEAADHLQRAVEIKTRAMGPDDPQVADALTNLANLDYARDDFATAETAYRRALDVYTRSLGPEHPDVGAALNNVGIVQWKRGELADAEMTLQQALAVWEHALGPNHPDLAATLLGLGEVALARGRREDAVVRLERALAVLQHASSNDEVLADVRFALARSLVQDDPERADALAASAAAAFVAHGESSRARLERVEAFLAGRHSPRKLGPADPL